MSRNSVPAKVWAGRVASALVVVVLLADAAIELLKPDIMKAEMEMTGFPMALSTPLGVIMLVCAFFYAIPQTSVLGAILVTGFFGGAICTHFRLGEMGSPPQLISLGLGVLAWIGLYLRDPRIASMLPFRRAAYRL